MRRKLFSLVALGFFALALAVGCSRPIVESDEIPPPAPAFYYDDSWYSYAPYYFYYPDYAFYYGPNPEPYYYGGPFFFGFAGHFEGGHEGHGGEHGGGEHGGGEHGGGGRGHR